MKKIGLAIAAAATAMACAAAGASAGPATTATIDGGSTLVQKADGSIYLDIGGPRYYGYGGYGGYDGYYDRPYYPSYGYGYYGPRYYRYGYGYGRYGHSRRWVKERFEHPLGRR